MRPSILFGLALVLSAGCARAVQLPPSTATFGGANVVEVPYRTVHGLVVIPVSINGSEPLQLILDTGAPVVVIRDTAMASRLNLKIVGQTRVGGAGDAAPRMAPLAAGITARIGSLEARDVVGIVGGIEGAIPGVDGVIGGPFFKDAVVEFDFDAKMIRFHNPATRTFTMAGDTVPLRVDPSLHSYIRGSVTVNGTVMPLDLHFDSGARQALALARATLEKHGATPAAKVSTIVGFGSRGAARGDIIRSDKLEIGRASFTRVTTGVNENEPGGEGRVGLPIMERFHLWVDYPGKRIVLQPRANFADPFPTQSTGLVFFPAREASLRVVAAAPPGTPAHEAGVQPGDTLVAVNGRDIRTFDEPAVRQQLVTPPAGAPIVLTIRRGGPALERTLTPRPLLP